MKTTTIITKTYDNYRLIRVINLHHVDFRLTSRFVTEFIYHRFYIKSIEKIYYLNYSNHEWTSCKKPINKIRLTFIGWSLLMILVSITGLLLL
jgi:hypothetical protein